MIDIDFRPTLSQKRNMSEILEPKEKKQTNKESVIKIWFSVTQYFD